jgi:hypothetical protein
VRLASARAMMIVDFNNVSSFITCRLATAVIVFGVSRISNEKFCAAMRKMLYGLGVAVTLGMSKWEYTATKWNQFIEAIFVDLVDNCVYAI